MIPPTNARRAPFSVDAAPFSRRQEDANEFARGIVRFDVRRRLQASVARPSDRDDIAHAKHRSKEESLLLCVPSSAQGEVIFTV